MRERHVDAIRYPRSGTEHRDVAQWSADPRPLDVHLAVGHHELDATEAAVAEGTGTSAQIKGYRVAGKTGTAQIAAGKDRESGYTANFSGFAPAENPKVAVSVTLQRPTKGYYGGTSAAPVFSEVTGYALRQMGVAPST